MSQSLYLSFVVTGLNLGLAALVYSRNPHHWVNRSFALFASTVAGWTLSTALGYQLAGTHIGLFWARCAFLMAASVVFAMLLFFHVFPFQATLPRSSAITIGATSLALNGLLSLSPWVATTVSQTPTGLSVTYGPLYPLFALHVLGCVTYSLALIIRKTRLTRGAERQQLRYLFLALLGPGLCATITNLLIPLATGSSQFGQYGPLFSVVMIGMIAHAIIRHRFLDIRLVVRRGVVYLIAAIIAGTVFTAVIALIAAQTSRHLHEVPLPLQVAVALCIALAFQPLKNWIQSRLDHYVYRESYDYRRLVRDASGTISATLDLDSLLAYLCDTSARALRPEFVAVFAHDPRSNHFILSASRVFVGPSSLPIAHLEVSSHLTTFLAVSGRALACDHVSTGPRDTPESRASFDLASLGGELALPMLSERRLIGILVVGPKLSGDAYFRDDLELLSTLCNQASIAMKNALLYGEVVLANEQIENILRTMDSGVIAVNASGRVAVSNATAALLTGLSKSSLSSLSVDELPSSLATQLRSTLVDGNPRLQVETTLPSDSSRLIPIVCSTAALRDSRGTILGALVVFSDLSKLKALESEKRRAERLAAFGTLVSGIAHEIKNPLVAIKTFAELLPERFEEPDFREDFAKVVITEIDRIDDLVARLRGLAAPSPHPQGKINIREPIEDTLALLRAQLEHTNTKVHRHFEDADPFVAVDAAQLKQLFLNLCLNAIQAMGPGGELTVRVTRRLTGSTAWIVSEVSDTGPGIPEAIRGSVFDPFFTTKPRGSGLGLAICRGITDAHRGTIRAESAIGHTGTTMIVEFPAASEFAELSPDTVLRA